jgi:hypothetical protein
MMLLGLTDTGAGTLAALTGKNSRHLLRGMVEGIGPGVSNDILDRKIIRNTHYGTHQW